MSDPTEAIRASFGSTPNTSTLKGLLEYSDHWLAEEAGYSTQELVKGYQVMVKTLEGVYRDTEADLQKVENPDSGLSEPIERSLAAYEELATLSANLVKSVEREDRSTTESLLEELEEAAISLDNAQHELDNWLNAPVLRCPQCGRSEVDPCQDCGLELLYPEPQAPAGQSLQMATLPAEYGPIYQAYLAVLKGESTLSTVLKALKPLEGNLHNLIAATNASMLEQPDNEMFKSFQDSLQHVLEGVFLMQRTAETRRTSDLREGWTQVFEGARQQQVEQTALIHELGGEQERTNLTNTLSGMDTVTFTGDG